MTRFLIAAAALAAFAGPSHAQFCAEQSISWTEESGAVHTTVIEGRIRDGCPMVRQSIALPGASPLETTGMDCDCDLIVDGEEARFSAPMPIVARRMLDVCQQNRASALPMTENASTWTTSDEG